MTFVCNNGQHQTSETRPDLQT